MTDSVVRKAWIQLQAGVGVAALLLLPACHGSTPDQLHGYVEGEYIYVASPLAGTVTLKAAKGGQVRQGDPLFVLENDAEMSARNEAEKRLLQAKAVLRDLGKGLRPTEMAALQAELLQAEAALQLAETEYGRQERLLRLGTVSVQSRDTARSARDQQLQRVARVTADVKTARLGGRSDQVAAAEANVRALEAVLARTEWELSQKSKRSPVAGLVYDTLFRSGEFVQAGRPVVVLLPPGNIKVRVFVPEARLAAIHPGEPVTVTVDGLKESFTGAVSYVSPKAEYTPPVIFSRESREKLVFMVEASFPAKTAVRLNPGQPVDLRFSK